MLAFLMSAFLAEAPIDRSQSLDKPADELRTHVEAPDPADDISNADLLDASQKEKQAAFESGLALSIGPVTPWTEVGASIFWQKYHIIQNVSLGGGSFEFSDNYKGRNYKVKTDSQSMYYSARWFFLGFGPLYLEPFAGLVRWTGSIKPNGFDVTEDSLASSLDSRFDLAGVSVGGNLGLMWIFDSGIFLDYNFLSVNTSGFVKNTFTTNTAESKRSVHRELGGPLTLSNLQLRIGYSLKL